MLKLKEKEPSLNIITKVVLIAVPVILTASLLQGRYTLFAREWFWLTIGCIFCLIQYPPYLKKRHISWLIIYAIIVFLNYWSGDSYFDSTTKIIMEIATLFFCSYLIFYLTGDNFDFLYFFVFSQLVTITITSALSIAADIVIPGVVRQTVMLVNGGYSEEAIPFYSMGVCHYFFPHGVPMILPGLVLIAKNSRIKLLFRVISMLLVAFLFYLVFISTVTTALLLSIIGIVISLFIKEGGLKKNISRLILLGLLLSPLLSDTIMLKVLTAAEEVVPKENAIATKIVSFEESMGSKKSEGSLEKREEKYMISVDAIISSPIIGSNKPIGGHAALLDRMAALGILGFIPFILFILYLFKLVKKRLPENSVVFFFVGIFGFILMLATKSMNNLYVWMYSFCLLPALIIFNSKPPRIFLK